MSNIVGNVWIPWDSMTDFIKEFIYIYKKMEFLAEEWTIKFIQEREKERENEWVRVRQREVRNNDSTSWQLLSEQGHKRRSPEKVTRKGEETSEYIALYLWTIRETLFIFCVLSNEHFDASAEYYVK